VSWGGSEPGSEQAREGGGRAKGSTRPARGGEREPARVHSARPRARDESKGRESRDKRGSKLTIYGLAHRWQVGSSQLS
jgi:hypothetical protein